VEMLLWSATREFNWIKIWKFGMPNYVFPTARQVICSVLIVAAMTIPLDLYDPESSDSRFPPPTAPHPIIIIMIIKT
jgi:hypothetical protein